MKFITSLLSGIKSHGSFQDKLNLPAIANHSIFWLKTKTLHWKYKIKKLINSPRERKRILSKIGFYVLAILLGWLIMYLIIIANTRVNNVSVYPR